LRQIGAIFRPKAKLAEAASGNSREPRQPQCALFGAAGSSSLSISCFITGVFAMLLKTSLAKKNFPSEGTITT